MIIPMALAATMLFGFGCASSNDAMNDTTAMDDNMTMSETQTMAGTTSDMEGADDMRTDNMATSDMTATATSAAALSMQNTGSIDDMFSDIDDTEQYDVLSLAKMDPNLSTFVALIEKSDLVSDLQRLDEYTLLAPTNEAFSKVPKEKLESLLKEENKAVLMSVLQMHVLPSEVSSLQFQNNSQIQVGEDSYIPVQVGVNNTDIRIGGAQIVKSNIEGSNGVIHVIDSVIFRENTQDTDAIGY